MDLKLVNLYGNLNKMFNFIIILSVYQIWISVRFPDFIVVLYLFIHCSYEDWEDWTGWVFQVDLKLKVCRGSSVCKILVREAKCYGAANVIVGTSKCHHTIQSSVSVAKYCAKNLPRNILVLAVDNGKILFQSEASDAIVCGLRGFYHFPLVGLISFLTIAL